MHKLNHIIFCHNNSELLNTRMTHASKHAIPNVDELMRLVSRVPDWFNELIFTIPPNSHMQLLPTSTLRRQNSRFHSANLYTFAKSQKI